MNSSSNTCDGRRLPACASLVFLLFGLNAERSAAFQSHKRNFPPAASTQGGGDDHHHTKKTILTDEMNILPQATGTGSEPVAASVDLIDVDLEKAQDFAAHFGKYSYEDIEHMRDDLHTHRLQNMALGNDEYSNDLLFLERVLEDDLTTQLNELRNEMPDPYLFRYPDKEPESSAKIRAPIGIDGLPGPDVFRVASSDNNTKKQHAKNTNANTNALHQKLDFYEELVEEGVLESLAICAILGVLMMAPAHLV